MTSFGDALARIAASSAGPQSLQQFDSNQLALNQQQNSLSAVQDLASQPNLSPGDALLAYAKQTGDSAALQKGLALKQMANLNLNDPAGAVHSGALPYEDYLKWRSDPNTLLMASMGGGLGAFGQQSPTGAPANPPAPQDAGNGSFPPSSPTTLPTPQITSADLPPIGQTTNVTSNGRGSTGSWDAQQPQASPPVSPPTGAPPAQPLYKPASADDKRDYAFLASLPPAMQGTILGLSDGDENSGSQALKSPLAMMYQAAAKRFDPSYSQTAYTARNKTAADFASGGKSGAGITSINTATHHLAQVALAAYDLHNSNIPALNYVANGVSGALGKDPTTNFQSTVNTVAPELAKAAASGGDVGEADRQAQKADFGVDGSLEQQLGAAAGKVQLLQGKADEMGNTYRKDMGHSREIITPDNVQTQKDIVFLHNAAKTNTLGSPDATAAFKRLRIAASQDPNSGTVPTTNASAPAGAAVTRTLPSGATYRQINGKWYAQ